ncbi:Rv1733c family protein [Actinomadura geliboluensis]
MKRARMWARANRWRRSLGLDGNDLRRDVDRAQRRLGIILLMLFSGITPPLAVYTAWIVHDSGVRAERYEAATWHRVDATAVKIKQVKGRHQVTVAWTEPGGTRRTGDYTTLRGPDIGTRVRVWAGPGTVSLLPPRDHSRTLAQTGLAVAGVALATGAPLLGLYRLARRRYNRRRDQLWDAAWARLDNHHIGP